MQLMQPYLDKGHHVYTDHYYSSIPLAQALLEKGTSFTGTMVKIRVDLPTEIRSSSFSLRNDETRVFRAGALLSVAWQAATKKKPLIIRVLSGPKIWGGGGGGNRGGRAGVIMVKQELCVLIVL